MKKSFRILSLLATGLAVVGCQDFDNGFSSEDIKKAEYAKNFEKTFGKVDPNQDWSMALQLTANVSVGGKDSHVAIYTDKPVYANTKILDAFQGSTHKFEALQGTSQVYAIVRENAKTLVAGYFDVVDGKVEISANPVAKKTSATRAFSDGSSVTKAYVEENVINARDTELKYVHGGMYKTLDEWREWATDKAATGDLSITNYAPFSADCVIPAGADWSDPELDPAKINAIVNKNGYWCQLNNVWGVYTLDEIIEEKKKVTQNIGYSMLPLLWSSLVSSGVNQWDIKVEDLDWSNAQVDLTQSGYYSVSPGDVIWWPTGASGYQKNTKEEIIDIVKARGTDNYDPFLASSIVKPAHLDFTHATLASDVPQGYDPNAWMIDLTYLGGVETEAAQPWALSLGYQLFGPKSFFMEDAYYFGPKEDDDFDKRTMYGANDAEKLETLKKIEAGFSITTKQGSEIEVPFIYGATIISDQFGYVYYKDGQDPLKQPHYILMKNGKPSTNIYYDNWGTSNGGTAVGDMALAGWRTEAEVQADGNPLYGLGNDTEVFGTKYKLTFFGENHDQTPSYKFDAGYHIVFFICPGEIDASDPRGVSGHQNININYSLPELNARIFNGHMYAGSTNSTYETVGTLTWQNHVNPEGIVKAAAWTSNGMTFMGFEDGGGDEDLNDIVFWVEGDYTPDQELIEVETKVKNNSLSWIFACEDLGGTFDYDFNDVVWEFSKQYDVVEETKVVRDSKGNIIRIIEGDPAPVYQGAKINLLAAGGTLPIELLYDEAALSVGGKTELHQIFGQDAASSYSVVNVGTKANTPSVTLKEFSSTEDLSLEVVAAKFKIAVHGNNGATHYVVRPGITKKEEGTDDTPEIIILPGTWEWPQEEVFINTAYPGFKNWANDATWAAWSENYDSSKTTKR